ncbi:MAG: large conductance mechanosensitive channel protein MscL [Rhodanobacter denitrificans]|uniref:Large-conductance mechanosensitive channel n=1 Tax=Rhodanobacter denitrificans TaxID=666685 RepID=A0A2W5K363_9GAMM|nr:MAG: large conductance mechanosensitive channel protein MscL [Rhodanobacter denitrificans]
MSFFSEFKTFAMRGNVIDLAVGVVIGGAFGKIVSSLVDQVIMPPIGYLIGGIDFSSYKLVLVQAGADGKGEVAVQYGAFFNTLIQFIIIAFAIFLVIKAINRLSRKEEAAPAAPPADVVLLTEIRDLLKANPAAVVRPPV